MLTRSLVAALLPIACLVAVAAPTEQAETHAPGASAELNRRFVDPELDVDRWVRNFEGESREVFAARHEVIEATGAKPGDRVADVGAGTGLFTRLFAEKVGSTGWVHAVEISPGFLQHINASVAEAGIENVTAVFGRTDSIQLPPASVDLVFLCDTYHHLEEVAPTMASIRRALMPGGRLVVVDFDRIPGTSREWVLNHVRAGKEVVRSEIEAAGFAFVADAEIPQFEENYLVVFRKK